MRPSSASESDVLDGELKGASAFDGAVAVGREAVDDIHPGAGLRAGAFVVEADGRPGDVAALEAEAQVATLLPYRLRIRDQDVATEQRDLRVALAEGLELIQPFDLLAAKIGR